MSTMAATVASGKSLVFTGGAPSSQNIYLAGVSVTVATTSPADLTVIGGSVVTPDLVVGDALIAAGTSAIRGGVSGDLRAIGGQIIVDSKVNGGLALFASSVEDKKANAKSILAIGLNIKLLSGSRGDVKAYGNDIYMSGTFTGNVYVSALNKLILAPNTVIDGTLKYEASEVATIPSSAKVIGGVTYTGSSFLPTSQEAEAFILAGIGIFFLVRILGELLVAGLFAGLFPVFTNLVAKDVFEKTTRHSLLMTLLGFSTAVATPALVLLLSITFVGFAFAFILGAAYILLFLVAFSYAGILVGALLARVFAKRKTTTWHDALVGMFVLMIVGSIPMVGVWIVVLSVFLSSGVILKLFYMAVLNKKS